MGRLAASVATESVTATRQLARLPRWPQYWRATPTESLPFFGSPVSSTIQARTGPRSSIAGSAEARTAASRAASSQAALATKWCKDWCAAPTRAGSTRAAIGSTLLRSPGSRRPGGGAPRGARRAARRAGRRAPARPPAARRSRRTSPPSPPSSTSPRCIAARGLIWGRASDMVVLHPFLGGHHALDPLEQLRVRGQRGDAGRLVLAAAVVQLQP